MNEEKPEAEKPAEPPPADVQRDEAQPPESQNRDPRRRLRELLAIPERDRSDAIWDEIVKFEIELAPGNRISPPQGDSGRRQEPGRRQESGRRPEQARRQDSPSDAKPTRRFVKRSRRGPGAPGKS